MLADVNGMKISIKSIGMVLEQRVEIPDMRMISMEALAQSENLMMNKPDYSHPTKYFLN